MRNLLEFLARYSNTLLFVLLEVVALVLIVVNNAYQKSAVFSSCNTVAAGMYTVSDNIGSYFSLKTDNQRLADENVALRERINQLENELALSTDTQPHDSGYVYADKNLTYVAARVINATTNRQHNYLTINKGCTDGIAEDMGVICDAGVVGVVCAASEHFALVIPILHTDLSISSKFLRNDYVGSLHWDGRDIQHARLADVARHVDVQTGDAVVTSGLSSIFPPEIPVGIVEKATVTDHDAFYDIRVRLAVDFKRLNHVTVIQNHSLTEQTALEERVYVP